MQTREREELTRSAPPHVEAGPKHRVHRERKPMAAGNVLVVLGVCLFVWLLLDADALKKSSEAAPTGTRRTLALGVLRPLSTLSKLVFLDTAGDAIESSLGRDPGAAPGGEGGGSGGLQRLGGEGGETEPTVSTRPQESAVPPPATTEPTPKVGGPGGTSKPTPSPSPTPKPRTPVERSVLPPLRPPTRQNPLTILVVGDSYGGDLAIGMQRNLDFDFITLYTDWQISTGLATARYVDWQPRIRTDVQKTHPDIVMVMIGGNDFLPVQYHDGSNVEFTDVKHWKPAYAQRIRQFVDGATSTGARVLWVGLPIMGDAVYSHQIERLNGMYERVAAQEEDVTYLDTWDLFTDKNGNYADYLPDAHGNLQQVRQADHEHIAPAGTDRLARYCIRVMERVWKLSDLAEGF